MQLLSFALLLLLLLLLRSAYMLTTGTSLERLAPLEKRARHPKIKTRQEIAPDYTYKMFLQYIWMFLVYILHIEGAYRRCHVHLVYVEASVLVSATVSATVFYSWPCSSSISRKSLMHRRYTQDSQIAQVCFDLDAQGLLRCVRPLLNRSPSYSAPSCVRACVRVSVCGCVRGVCAREGGNDEREGGMVCVYAYLHVCMCVCV